MHLASRLGDFLQPVLRDEQYRSEPAVSEIYYVLQRAEKLVENCRNEGWLVKAVELGDCEEHFTEILIEMRWSTGMAQIGREPRCQLQILERNYEALLRSLREDLTEEVISIREADKGILLTEIRRLVEVEPPHANCTRDYDLASLLQDRISPTWCPPELRAFRLDIHGNSIGKGALGVVIEFPWLRNVYALKKPHKRFPENPEFLKKEAGFLDKYRNPHIIGLIGHWVIDGRPHLLTELMHCDLQTLINTKHFACSEATDIMWHVAKAMRFLHFKDVAYRDLKPGNIMCNVKGDSGSVTSVKLIDFGDALDDVTKYTDGGFEWRRAGTTEYTAPEVINNECKAQIDLKKADVHSFGMVFFEVLTRKVPSASLVGYNGKSRMELLRRLKDGQRPLLTKDTCPYLKFIIASCWDADPKRRPTFQDLCKLLQYSRNIRSGVCNEEAAMFTYTDEYGNTRENQYERN